MIIRVYGTITKSRMKLDLENQRWIEIVEEFEPEWVELLLDENEVSWY